MKLMTVTLVLGAALAFEVSCKSRAPEQTEPILLDPPAAVDHHRRAAIGYPVSRRGNVTDVIHGVVVLDPYRWLEDASAPEVQEWVDAQDRYARAKLANLPGRDAIARRLSDVMYYDSTSAPEHHGSRYFYSRKHKDKEKRVVYWREGEHGPEHVLLDPNTWSTDGSSGLKRWAVSWDGRYVAYNVSEHNADETSLDVVEVATGRKLKDEIPNTRFGQTSWSPDNLGFYYDYTPPASDKIPEADRSAYTELRHHTLGDDWTKDAIIHPALGTAGWFVTGIVSEDGHWLFMTVSRGSSGSSDWYFLDLRDRKAKWATLVEGVDADFTLTYYQDRFYLLNNYKAPRYRLVVVDPAKPARQFWREVVPESDAALENADVFGGKLVLSYLRDAASVLEIHDLNGKLVRKIDMPSLGSSSDVVGRIDEDTFYFSYSSFTQPNVVYKASVKNDSLSAWSHAEIPVDTTKFVTEQVHYKSRDGTSVPMFIVHNKDARRDGWQPTLLTGYGGFRITIKPEFYARYAVWLGLGGVVAVANLRGGGEYGEEWHQAGMLDKKQNVFDDFIAAADYLETSGWTSPTKMAAYGGSNGGLLMGAAVTQVPEMFKAIVCFVPLLDMVRYHKFGLGKAWVSEYGSTDDPDQFKTLLSYSPYHHVPAGKRMPAFLMMSADHDDRVDPMHARKFTAALQAASDRPVWLRVERNAGHGGADVVRQQVDQWTDAIAFAWDQVGR